MQQVSEPSPWRLDYDQVDASRWNQASEQSRPRNPRIMPPDPAALVVVFGVQPVEPSRPYQAGQYERRTRDNGYEK